jgi:hypothetical protein
MKISNNIFLPDMPPPSYLSVACNVTTWEHRDVLKVFICLRDIPTPDSWVKKSSLIKQLNYIKIKIKTNCGSQIRGVFVVLGAFYRV